MPRVPTWTLTMAGACVVAMTGCGGNNLVSVKGVVTLDGKPLANASVIFNSPVPGGRDANGFTDANGGFVLSTFRPKDGALPGLYKVTVHYSEPVPIPPGLKSAAEVQKATSEAAKTHKQSLVIPPMYSHVDQTPLQHKVPEDGDVKLELRSEPR